MCEMPCTNNQCDTHEQFYLPLQNSFIIKLSWGYILKGNCFALFHIILWHTSHGVESGSCPVCGDGPFQSIRRHLSASVSCGTVFHSRVSSSSIGTTSNYGGGGTCGDEGGKWRWQYEAEEELEERQFSWWCSDEEYDSWPNINGISFNFNHKTTVVGKLLLTEQLPFSQK